MEYLAFFAFIISIISLFLNIKDRFPRLYISADLKTFTEYMYDQYPIEGETVLWITISNQSARRILITDVYAQWSWHLLLPLQWKAIKLSYLERHENEKREPFTRFWIEPWGNVVLSALIRSADGQEEGLEYELRRYFSSWYDKLFHLMLSYRIIVFDGQGKKYSSNKNRIINPSIMRKNFFEIFKMYFNRTKP